MRPARILLALSLGLLAAAPAFAVTKTIRIFDKRQIVIAVPEGWKFNLTKNGDVPVIHLEDRADAVNLDASFFPDADNELATEEALEARMRDLFAPVDAETTFTFTKTSDGVEGHAHLGDATKGIRSWPGVYLVFTITGDDAKALEIVTNALREVAK
jgi:hypothetical protein